MARGQGAETIDLTAEHSVEALRRLTRGLGADRDIDAVGVDAYQPSSGPADSGRGEHKSFEQEVARIDPLRIPTQRQPLTSAPEAYKIFAPYRPAWVKVELEPAEP